MNSSSISRPDARDAKLHTEAEPNSTGFWTASEHLAPPQDGSPFWAWLHQTGVRRMVWDESLFEDGGGYVLADDPDEEFEPDFWAPLAAIPDPAVEFAHLREDA